jgi:acyl-CoA thioesterase FadM
MTTSLERALWRTEAPLSAEGPNGLVQPQRILEWMQEAAAHASRVAGYPPERYKEMGAAWFIREVVLVVDGEIRYGEKIAIETWIADNRRFRTHRQYRVTGDGKVVARGEVDWTLLERDPATGKVRPLRFDDGMKAAFPVVPERVIRAGEVPELGEDPERAFDLPSDERKVRPTEIDHNGHVNHVYYLEWLEDHARLGLGDALELQALRIAYVNDVRRAEKVSISGWSENGVLRQRIDRGDLAIARAVMLRRAVTP